MCRERERVTKKVELITLNKSKQWHSVQCIFVGHSFTAIQSSEIDTNWKRKSKKTTSQQLAVGQTNKTIFWNSFRQLIDVNEECFVHIVVDTSVPSSFYSVRSHSHCACLVVIHFFFCCLRWFVLQLFPASAGGKTKSICHITHNWNGLSWNFLSLSSGKCIYLDRKKGVDTH